MYPPGIPILAKGEIISTQILENLKKIIQAFSRKESDLQSDLNIQHKSKTLVLQLPSGVTITGCRDSSLQSILIYNSF